MKARYRLEQTLTEVIERHLGGSDTFDPNYSNRMLARKFIEFHGKGALKFSDSNAKADALALEEMKKALEELKNKYYEISLGGRNRLNSIAESVFKEMFESADRDILKAKQNSDNPEVDLDQNLFSIKGFLAICGCLDQVLDCHRSELPAIPLTSKVNWSACAAAHMARIAWAKRKGVKAPRSVHADAQGPFGDFLEDVLDTITDVYWEHESPVTARSALRALENITNKGMISFGNW